jgi:hypothetical protein
MFTRAAGSSAYLPFTAPAGAQSPQISTDANGYLIATWTSGGVTYTSVYDAVAPSVDSVTPPSSPVAGQAASFTISGSDVWGPVTYTVDFGDGQPPASGRVVSGASPRMARATLASSVQHTYSGPGDYTATITVRDSAANSATRTVPVAVAAAADPTPVTLPLPLPPVTVPGLPDPVVGVTANVAPVKPVVRIKAPGARAFVALSAPAQIRIGSLIDARKGRVRITIANGRGGFATADFYEGLFKLTQPKVKLGQFAFANLLLNGGSFKGCPRAPKNPKLAGAAKTKAKSKTRSVRHLWGDGTGSFRTVGRFSSATIRGTTWLTDDRCNGTLTKVTKGKIGVRDFVRRKTIVLKARKSYLAKPRALRSKR